MNPKMIREKDVSNLLAWKYSLSNKRPLAVRVYFVALKKQTGKLGKAKQMSNKSTPRNNIQKKNQCLP
jgi:hypothetical protein